MQGWNEGTLEKSRWAILKKTENSKQSHPYPLTYYHLGIYICLTLLVERVMVNWRYFEVCWPFWLKMEIAIYAKKVNKMVNLNENRMMLNARARPTWIGEISSLE